jgi:mono/diheme cytochrome c family protein
MPALEETYRNQRVLHIVFAISSVAMFASIIWMMAADHYREWKEVQRDFIDLEAARTERETDVAQINGEIAELQEQLEAARAEVAEDPEVQEAQQQIDNLLGDAEKATTKLSFRKADRDSIGSFYDIELERGDEAAAKRIKDELDALDRELEQLRQQSEDLDDQLKLQRDRLAKANAKVTDLEKKLTEKEKELQRVEQKKWSFTAALRASPIMDAFSSPLKIDQIVLNDLTINYSFRNVPRFDRCATCHRAIDSITKEDAPQYDDRVIADVSHGTGWDSPHKNAFKTHTRPELFAGAKSPHPRERFGCTVCHMGQGSGTSFVFASHSPNSIEKEAEWKEHYDWEEIHHWPYPMHRARFVESGCVKCHPHVVDLETHPQFGNTAPKLVKGYHLVREFGCFGCHEINGFKGGRMIGPDLRLEPQTDSDREKVAKDPTTFGQMRKVGPSLRHIAQKTTPDWTFRWVKLPRGFRPDTRMPQFYGLSNNTGQTKLMSEQPHEDAAISDVEIAAIVHYLYTRSQEAKLAELPEGVAVHPASPEQATRGRERFVERGCLACHKHKEVSPTDYHGATADFGPDLSNVAAKLLTPDGDPNVQWLFNWLRDPTVHHARAFMPNLQLAAAEAADIAAWLLSVDGTWVTEPARPAKVDEKILDELVALFLQKSMTLKQTREVLSEGKLPATVKQSSDERLLAAPVSTDKKLEYLGKKTLSRMGCFGCHDIPGFETSKPIGTELSNWGVKARLDPDKLDFAHIVEYLEHEVPHEQHDADFELFLEGMKHHPFGKGESFLWQKLREPRSYDYKKLKAWDDKLRMPRFTFDPDPKKNAEAIEAVMTFVLGLVADDSIPAHYRNVPQNGPKLARIAGARALDKFNCRGCHMMRMPQFVFDPKKNLDPEDPTRTALPDPAELHGLDYPETEQDQAAMTRAAPGKPGKLVSLRAMLVDTLPSGLPVAGQIPPDAEELVLESWEPVKIEGTQYYIGDRFNVLMKAIDQSKSRPADGGQFAELLATQLLKKGARSVRESWNRVPPPLVREGMKAQPAWLHQFLLNPQEIRPAVLLRMPKFNMSSDEAAALATYFAAVDGVESPYEYVHQRDPSYLAEKEQTHARPGRYLRDGWRLLTLAPDPQAAAQLKLCASCHDVGNRVAGGDPAERGPNLRLTPDRLRPEWLRQWIAKPDRMLPFTAMPQNLRHGQVEFQEQFPGSSVQQIIGLRDTLMNYHEVQQRELVSQPTAQASTGGN